VSSGVGESALTLPMAPVFLDVPASAFSLAGLLFAVLFVGPEVELLPGLLDGLLAGFVVVTVAAASFAGLLGPLPNNPLRAPLAVGLLLAAASSVLETSCLAPAFDLVLACCWARASLACFTNGSLFHRLSLLPIHASERQPARQQPSCLLWRRWGWRRSSICVGTEGRSRHIRRTAGTHETHERGSLFQYRLRRHSIIWNANAHTARLQVIVEGVLVGCVSSSATHNPPWRTPPPVWGAHRGRTRPDYKSSSMLLASFSSAASPPTLPRVAPRRLFRSKR
jgi:hypothetical protein